MRICATAGPVADALHRMGHEVLTLRHQDLPPVFDLPEELERRDFTPDLVLQTESLSHRTLYRGLGELDCLKVFWSIDTHLNLFWQQHYFRLFDGIATPHASLLEPAGPGQEPRALPPVLRLPWYGEQRPWKPHATRQNDVAFVGRVTEHRPLRQWLAAFLQEHCDAAVAQDLTREQMFRLYEDSRLAPNESIACEVNFRLLETASCGCLCLSQNVGPDQDALLEPGEELLVYDDVLELQEQLDRCLRSPADAETMARKAWERVQREHLPWHRAASLLDFVQGLGRCAATGDEARLHYALAFRELHRAGRMDAPAGILESRLETLPQTWETRRALLGLLLEQGRLQEALARAAAVLSEQAPEDAALYNLAGSCVWLLAEQWPLARQFWLRQCKATGRLEGVPDTPQQLLLHWAGLLDRKGLLTNWGSPFQPGLHLPSCAVECLQLAQHLGADKLEVMRRLDRVYARTRGGHYYRLGTLSELSLHEPAAWRHGLALGRVNLQSYRLRQGLEELLMAWRTASAQGREASFFRTLQGHDPRGLSRKALLDFVRQSPETINTPES